jgi:hypothetical protein
VRKRQGGLPDGRRRGLSGLVRAWVQQAGHDRRGLSLKHE